MRQELLEEVELAPHNSSAPKLDASLSPVKRGGSIQLASDRGNGMRWQISAVAALPHSGGALVLGTTTGELIGLQRLTEEEEEEAEEAGEVPPRWAVSFVQRLHNGHVYDVAVAGGRVASAGHDAVCCVTTFDALSAAYTPNRLCGYGWPGTTSTLGDAGGVHEVDDNDDDHDNDGLSAPIAPAPPLRLVGHSLPVVQVRFTSDGGSLVSLSIDGQLRVTRLGAGGAEVRAFGCGFLARCFVLSADETMAYVGGEGLARVDLAATQRPDSEAVTQRWADTDDAAAAAVDRTAPSWLRRSESWRSAAVEKGWVSAEDGGSALCVSALRLVPPGTLSSSSLSDSRLEATVGSVSGGATGRSGGRMGTLVWNRAEEFCKPPSAHRREASVPAAGCDHTPPSPGSLSLRLLYETVLGERGRRWARERGGAAGATRGGVLRWRTLPGFSLPWSRCTGSTSGDGERPGWGWPLEDQRTTVLLRRPTPTNDTVEKRNAIESYDVGYATPTRDTALRTTQERLALLEAEKNQLEEVCSSLVRAIKSKRAKKA